ncbi:uncharacterized protein LOC124165738 [Ischnura elegans]|uniref:uncharacterized protein LOC124165738 n=1 Tax=Ischnura elegans TaxID=197161 RepID=UPI001ED894D1|nr:uncharacterized protein LOC124165738 [Ischnura elegans]
MATDYSATLAMVWNAEVLDALIELVSKRPHLYDHSDPDYYDKQKVYSSWTAIGQRLGRRPSQVRSMWRQLVKIFVWIHYNEHYKLSDDCYWPHLEKLAFLRPFAGNNTVRMNMACGEELIDYEASMETGMPVAAFITYRSESDKTEEAEDGNMDTSTVLPDEKSLSRPPSPFGAQDAKDFTRISTFPPSLNGMAMQKSFEVEEVLCQYLRKKVAKEKDPNALFLTSVAHDMKMLSSQDQAVFKMKVQQLLVEMISKTNGDME